MAMTLDTAIKFTAKLEGQGLDQLKRGLQGLAQQSNRTSRDLDQLYSANKKLSQASGLSVNSLQRQITVMTNLRNEAQIGSRQFKFYSAELEKLQKQQARLTPATKGGGIGGLLAMGGGLGGLAAAAGGTLAVKYVADVGMQAENAQVRLRALTNEFGEYNQAQVATERIAKTLRISNTEAQESFASLYASLRPTGITLKELEGAFIGFSAAARNSGATAQETSNALIQLKQGLASGVLQGEELRSIREQAPIVAQAIAKELKTNVGGLKDLAAEGKVTTDVVLTALNKLKGTQLGKLNEQFDTGAQALKDLNIATEKLGITLAKVFGPTAVKLIQAFTRVLERASDLINGSGDTQSRLQAQAQAQAEARRKFGIAGGFTNPAEFDAFVKQRTEAILESNRQAAAKARDKAQQLTPEQKKIQEDARKEREAAANSGATAEAKKRLDAELKIRESTEQRLRDFREQSIQRAADLERDLGDQRLQLERNTAEARRRIAAQEADFQTERERLRLRANGLSTDALDLQQRLNDATRRFTEQKIQIEQNATEKQVQLERTIEDYKLNVARGISEILQDAADKMAQKMVGGAKQAASELSGGSAAAGSVPGKSLGVGKLVGLARQAGFKGQDAATMAAIAMAESRGRSGALNNNPRTGDLSYGLWQINMLGGMGPQRRRAFGIGSNEALFDPATNANAARRVFESQGFGAWSVYRSGAYKNYLPAAMAAAGGGGAVAGASATPGLPGVAAAGQRLSAAIAANRGAGTTAALGDLIGSRQAELGNVTSELDQQRRSVGDQLRDYQRMLELQRTGLSPELAKQRVEAENAARAETTKLTTLRDQLVQDREIAGLTDKQKAALDGMIASIDERVAKQPDVIAGLTAEQQQLEQLQQAYEMKKQMVEGIANSIGNGIGGAIDLLIDGTDNWGQSLQQISAGVLKDIARQIAQTMVVAPIVKGITKAFGFADGGIMTAEGPLPLRKYAGGGIASSPQLAMFGEGSMPEAFVPLPDGRRIPVAMQGGGGSPTINVSVDAKGTSVQGDGGRGEQLGLAISQAVQAELIKQKRPGGLIAA